MTKSACRVVVMQLLFTVCWCVVLALLTSSPVYAADCSARKEGPRYQVVNSTTLASGQVVPVTLLVDTVTGKTWVLALNENNLPLWNAIPIYTNMQLYSGNKVLTPSTD